MIGHGKVETEKRPETCAYDNSVRVKFRSGMRISGTVRGLPVTWKVDTGARNTFITSETYKKISYSFRPGLKTSKKTFVAANGNKVKSDGETTVLFGFGDLG